MRQRIMKPGTLAITAIALANLFGAAAKATTYYVSSSRGNDERTSIEARNPATPWKSLEKVNSFFGNLGPGDSVLFKRGDVFCGYVQASASGTVFSPVYLGAYGSGNKPVITGFTVLRNWKLVKNGIYEATCEANAFNLTINGNQQAMGRYPNKGYLTYESHYANTSITDNQLTGGTDWTGAEVVIRKNRWVIDKSKITGQQGGTLNYAVASNAEGSNGFGYFIQNDARTLDQFGEWYYSPARKTMMVYFGNKNPNSYTVKTATAANLVNIRRNSYISFENITFNGSTDHAVNIIQGRGIILKNCVIDQAGAEGVFANYTPNIKITDCIINHSLSGGISLDAGCANSIVQNNTFKNIGLMAGMGKSGTGTYEAITSFSDNTMIQKNRIDSIGYNGIYLGGNHAVAKNNYVTYFCLVKDDGAGIYIGDWSKTVNKQIIGNIVMHGVGNSDGATWKNSLQAEGIYIDDNSASVTITDNTVSQCANNGIKIHNAKDISVYNNLVYNNGVQLRLEQDHYMATSTYIRNNDIRNNTFYSNSKAQPAVKISTHQDDIAEFGHLDSNFYYRPKVELSTIVTTKVKNGKDVKGNYNLHDWKSAYGKDQSSEESADNAAMLFEYNTTGTAKTVALKQLYTDVHNKVYAGKVVIKPYSAVLLMAGGPRMVAKVSLPKNLVLASR